MKKKLAAIICYVMALVLIVSGMNVTKASADSQNQYHLTIEFGHYRGDSDIIDLFNSSTKASETHYANSDWQAVNGNGNTLFTTVNLDHYPVPVTLTENGVIYKVRGVMDCNETVGYNYFQINPDNTLSGTSKLWYYNNGSWSKGDEIIRVTYDKAYTVSYAYDTAYTVPAGAPNVPASSYYYSSQWHHVADSPSLAGYTFSGWSCQGVTIDAKGDVKVTGNITFVGHFIPETYNVSYSTNLPQGVSVTGIPANESKNVGETVSLTTPTAAGYEFTGWTSTPNVAINNNSFTMPANDVSLVANFAKTYTAKFMSDGKEIPNSAQTLKAGDTIKFPSNPTRTGYKFTGWNPSNVTVMPANDITFTAQFEADSHTVSYEIPNNPGFTVPANETKNTGEKFGAASKPQNITGYTFDEWTTSDATKDNNGQYTMPASDVTFTGSFTKNSWTLTYVANGQTVSSDTVEYGASKSTGRVTKPSKPGYTFSKWTSSDVTIAADGSFTMPDNDVTITAEYTPNEYSVSYSISGAPAGINPPAEKKHACDSTVAQAQAESVTGYTFGGWKLAQDSTPVTVGADGTFTMPAGNVTFIGQYEKINYGYTVRYGYYENNAFVEFKNTKKTGDLYIDSDLSDPEYTIKTPVDAYPTYHLGDDEDETVKVTLDTEKPSEFKKDVVFVKNAAGEYTITFKYVYENGNGNYVDIRTANSFSTDNKKYSVAESDWLLNLESEGYKFSNVEKVSGHADSSYNNGKGEYVAHFNQKNKTTVVNVIYTPIEYTVTYTLTGNTTEAGVQAPETKKYTVGTQLKVADKISVPGFTFEGWDTTDALVADGSFAMPAGNVEFNGKITAIAYNYKIEYVGIDELGNEVVLLTETNGDKPIYIYTDAFDVKSPEELQDIYRLTDGEPEKVNVKIIAGANGDVKDFYAKVMYELKPEQTFEIVYGYYDKNNNFVAFDGLTDTETSRMDKFGVEDYTLKTNSIPEGYELSKLEKDSNVTINIKGGEYNFNVVRPATGNKSTVKVVCIPIEYNVFYEIDGNVIPDGAKDEAAKLKGNAAYTSTVKVAEDLDFAGYKFSGWTEKKTDNTLKPVSIEDGEFVMPARDVILTGSFELIPYNYTVNFVSDDDGDGDWTELYSPETGTLTVEDDPVKVEAPDYYNDYKLIDESQAEVVVELDKQNPENITIDVKYLQKDFHSLTVVYGYEDANGEFKPFGENVVESDLFTDRIDCICVEVYKLKDIPAGYEFSELKVAAGDARFTWNPEEEAYTLFAERSDVNAVINVVCVPLDYSVTYTLTGNVPEGVTAPAAQTVTFGTVAKVADNLTAKGYAFSGWTTGDAEVKNGSFTMPNKDVTFTGNFDRSEFTLTITYERADGTVLFAPYVADYAYGSDYRVESPAYDHGYTMDTVVRGTMPAEDLNIKVTYFYVPDNDPDNTPDEPVPTNTPDEPVPTNTPDEPVPTKTPDEPVPTKTPDEPVPTAAPEIPVDEPETPQGEPEVTAAPSEPEVTNAPEEPEVTAAPTEESQPDDIDLGEPENPQGDAMPLPDEIILDESPVPQGDALPKTGVVSAAVLYGLGAGFASLGTVVAVKARRREEDE